MEKSKYASNFCDLTGKQFGRLKVLSLADSKHGCSQWLCQCECGSQRVIRGRHLKMGRATSCGCWNRELHRQLMLTNPISPSLELSGQKFGRLIVVAREKSKHNRSHWLCVCDCGAQVVTSGKNLRDGKKKSCGCLRREMLTIPAENTSNPDSRFRIAYSQYRANAEKRNLAFPITREQFDCLVKQTCFYCGRTPEIIGGVDRKDNNIGYTVENCVACCQVCNYMKRGSSVEAFLQQCREIVGYQNHKQ